MDSVFLITLDILDTFDRPLAICSTAEEALTALNDFTNAFLKKKYRASRSNILIYRIPLNDTSEYWEMFTAEALLGFITNDPYSTILAA